MRKVFLGGSGLAVSRLAMGTQTFGWGADETTSWAMADRFVEAGGSFFDTASTYNGGAAESILGSWIEARRCRQAVVVGTKVFFPTGDGPNDSGLSRKHILHSVEQSLGRLRTDYIDLYQAHCFDMSTPLEETLDVFDGLVRAGKVRYAGVSNFSGSQLVRAVMTGRMRRHTPLVSLQAEYSLLVRSTEWELLPLCREEGLTLLAWSPLAGGWLSGKYVRGASAAPDSRVGKGERWDDLPAQRENESTWKIIECLQEIARTRGRTCSQVALNYLLHGRDFVVPIFGARTMAQLDENLGSVGWELGEEEARMLDTASAIPLPYPYRFIERYTRRRGE
jgi:aryl-alcohol dehydrogenase-like predicted oxidoreductase